MSAQLKYKDEYSCCARNLDISDRRIIELLSAARNDKNPRQTSINKVHQETRLFVDVAGVAPAGVIIT